MALLLSVLEQGMIYGILALGVYITYKILDFPDLTVEVTGTGGVFMPSVAPTEDEKEAERLRRKKKRRKGRSL